MSSSSRPQTLHSYHNAVETPRNYVVPSLQRILPYPSPFQQSAHQQTLSPSGLPAPNTPSISSSLSQITTPNLVSTPIPPLHSLSAPAKSVLAGLIPNDLAGISRNSPSWQAARDSVLSQMITSQDLAVPVTLPRVKAKTGGRRGRGGRRPAIEAEGQVDKGTAAAGGSQVEGGEGVVNHGKGRGRRKGGGRPRVQRAGGVGRGLKRKRRPSDDEEGASKDDTDASETFTPLPAQSRSGRRIFKATAFTPAVIDLEANSASQPPVQNRMSGAVDEGKKGKKRHRKPGEASVCKNCGRGHSPGSNMIVFCDGCDTPWHQHCHDPRINAEVVRIEEMEWFCADCELLKEAKAQVKGKISSEGMTMVEKRRYLSTLPHSQLIFLLLHATNLYPDLPIFSAIQSIAPTSSSSAKENLPALINALPVSIEEEDTFDLYSETDPLPYPKAGNGVPLPPESDDLTYLIDDDAITFSHAWGWDRGKLFERESFGAELGLWDRGRVEVGA